MSYFLSISQILNLQSNVVKRQGGEDYYSKSRPPIALSRISKNYYKLRLEILTIIRRQCVLFLFRNDQHCSFTVIFHIRHITESSAYHLIICHIRELGGLSLWVINGVTFACLEYVDEVARRIRTLCG